MSSHIAKAEPDRPQLPHFLHRLMSKVNPAPPARYGPHRKHRALEDQPPLFSRLLSRRFPSPARTDVPWYTTSIGNKLDHTLDFFVRATGTKGEELAVFLHSIRDRAWAVDAYPCWGQWWFLLPGISGSPWYEDVVIKPAREGAIVLDLGCGLGQEIRRVASIEGVNQSQLYAVDVSPEIWKLGLELFTDAQNAPAQFIEADARIDRYAESLQASSEDLFSLTGKVDIVFMSLVLDLFHFPDQILVGKTVAELSKVGTQVIGYARGTISGKAQEGPAAEGGPWTMVHDDLSLKTLWWEIGENSKTKWRVESKLVEVEELGWEKSDVSWMGGPPPMGIYFVITREK